MVSFLCRRSFVALFILTTPIAFCLLTRKEKYVDLGEDYFDKQKQQSIVKYAIRRLESLGYSVSIS